MKVLGIAGHDHDGAVALAVDGEVIAAAAEESFVRLPGIGYRHTGGFPFAAVDACLTRAGLALEDIAEIAVVEDRAENGGAAQGTGSRQGDHELVPPVRCDPGLVSGLRSRSTRSVDPLHADAIQTAASVTRDTVICILGHQSGSSGSFVRRGGHLMPIAGVAGTDQLVCAARCVARLLGCDDGISPYESLERLGALGEPQFAAEFADAIQWTPDSGVSVQQDRLMSIFERAGSADALARRDNLNHRVQSCGQALAASFCGRLAEVAIEIAGSLRRRTGVRTIGLGGALFASSRLNGELRRALGEDAYVAAIPETRGRAIGAALEPQQREARPLRQLSLGPSFSETEIKLALDNCRLDYLYEPDWPRLLRRVSRLLARGSVVAWVQGRMDFGPRSLGARSILCDPSNRYARDNVNKFLKQRPLEDPLPVSMTESAAAECLASPVASPFMFCDAAVESRWRDRLRGALDHRSRLPVHTVMPGQAPELLELLTIHREATGVPALINTTLSGAGEPTACTPRDAIRTMFSSAIDVLVIGRFLLMKDYWLLRSDSGQ